jgi:hypothetical protein
MATLTFDCLQDRGARENSLMHLSLPAGFGPSLDAI